MNTEVLKVENLVKEYETLKAVDNISFSIRAGEIVGLLGPNGAGKTTTINMILGILEPSSGRIEIFCKDIKTSHTEVCQGINFAAVYAHLPANLTVYQNLYIFGLIYGVKNLKERIKFLFKKFDLENFADKKAGLLSSGELSRLNLAKAIINEPALLLLDEPTASLDPNIAHEMRQEIKEYAAKTEAAVLWTSHNMHEIEAVCERVLFLARGKILLSGNPKTLPQEHGKKDLEELFIAIAREPLMIET
jgi:ABC-2 type transport system ATP-binding protein